MQHTNNTTLHAYTEVNGITYQLVGDVYLPMIAVEDKPRKPLGYWGRQRRNYLMREQSGTYAELLLTGTISDHLEEIEEAPNIYDPSQYPDFDCGIVVAD